MGASVAFRSVTLLAVLPMNSSLGSTRCLRENRMNIHIHYHCSKMDIRELSMVSKGTSSRYPSEELGPKYLFGACIHMRRMLCASHTRSALCTELDCKSETDLKKDYYRHP